MEIKRVSNIWKSQEVTSYFFWMDFALPVCGTGCLCCTAFNISTEIYPCFQWYIDNIDYLSKTCKCWISLCVFAWGCPCRTASSSVPNDRNRSSSTPTNWIAQKISQHLDCTKNPATTGLHKNLPQTGFNQKSSTMWIAEKAKQISHELGCKKKQ